MSHIVAPVITGPKKNVQKPTHWNIKHIVSALFTSLSPNEQKLTQ